MAPTQDSTDKLLKLVNSSGFPFQLSVEEEVRKTQQVHGWKIVATEQPWRNDQGRQGYIDIILAQERQRLILECKRVREGDWLFLLPQKPLGAFGTQLRYLWTRVDPPLFRWHDFYDGPESKISEFCVIRGSSDDQSPMIERLGGILVESIEAVAREELLLSANSSYKGSHFYLPIIVTNARLQLCGFDPSDISLTDGTLDKANFTQVPFVRFRKTLTPDLPNDILPCDIGYANKLRSRTVLVANAEAFITLLKDWPSDLKEQG